jgi:hypothetical protein
VGQFSIGWDAQLQKSRIIETEAVASSSPPIRRSSFDWHSANVQSDVSPRFPTQDTGAAVPEVLAQPEVENSDKHASDLGDAICLGFGQAV